MYIKNAVTHSNNSYLVLWRQMSEILLGGGCLLMDATASIQLHHVGSTRQKVKKLPTGAHFWTPLLGPGRFSGRSPHNK